MSDEPIGDDWWQASDGKWYPPETHPDRAVTETPAAAPEPDPKRGTFSVLPDPVPGERVLVDPDTVPTPGNRTAPDQPSGSPLFGTQRSGTGEGSTWAPGGAGPSGAPSGMGAPPGAGAPAGLGGPGTGAASGGPSSAPPGAPNLTPRHTPPNPADIAKAPKGRGKKAKLAKPGTTAKTAKGGKAGRGDGGRPGAVATADGGPEDVRSNRTLLILGAAAALIAVAAAVYFLFLSGDDPEVADVPATVKSETTTSANNSAAPSTTAPGTATTVAVDPDDPDAACRQALVAEDQAQAFQVCDAYQFRRLQPEVAPNRPDLDTACKQVTYGDACIFIPTTLPPPAFEPVQATGQGNGSVPIPGAASGGILEIRNDGAAPLTVAGASGVIAERPGGSTGSHYIGDLSATGTLTVTAQGPWTVTVKPPTQARDATLRAVGFGSDVVFLDNPTEKSVHFTHDGAGQFTVIGHPLVGADTTGSVALDQTGPVDTSVVVRGAIIEIRATGNWTLVPE